MPKLYTRFPTNAPELDRVQTEIDRAFKGIESSDFIGGVFIDDISITAGTVKYVRHKLGKKWRRFILSSQNTNAVVWAPDANNTDSIRVNYIGLDASASCKISIWVV